MSQWNSGWRISKRRTLSESFEGIFLWSHIRWKKRWRKKSLDSAAAILFLETGMVFWAGSFQLRRRGPGVWRVCYKTKIIIYISIYNTNHIRSLPVYKSCFTAQSDFLYQFVMCSDCIKCYTCQNICLIVFNQKFTAKHPWKW